MSNQGHMRYQDGVATTYSGHPIDEMISAVHKYIRRNIPEKAVTAGFELYRMSEINDGERFRTQLYHRIAVIAAEEIGPSNIGLVVIAMQLTSSKNYNPDVLGSLLQILSNSPKTRVASHLYWALISPEGRSNAKQIGISIDDTYTLEDVVSFGSNGISWVNSDPEDIRPFAEIFKRRLQVKSITAIIWLGYYMRASDGKKIAARAILPRRRQTDPIMVIFEILRDFVPKVVWELLVESYITIPDKIHFLMLGVLIVIYQIPYEPYDLSSAISAWTTSKSAQQYLQGCYSKLELDPYVIDMHTKAGRKNKMGRREFILEGSLVSPIDQRFRTIFESIYLM